MILSLLLAGMGTAATAQNINLPIIQTKYTADPAPYVHNDTVYLYTTHDEDGAEGFLMKDWLLYTSTDMVNWQVLFRNCSVLISSSYPCHLICFFIR